MYWGVIKFVFFSEKEFNMQLQYSKAIYIVHGNIFIKYKNISFLMIREKLFDNTYQMF